MSRIFISYRRQDTGMGVGRLADSLREHFAREQVFQDISSIDPGADFIEALQNALADCAAVLVVIGPRWLTVTDSDGQRRLDDPEDWVRQEIVEALGRPGLRVFPLLVDGAEMPSAARLPDVLKPLARRQAYELTLRHWSKDVAVLVETLQRIPTLASHSSLSGAAQPSTPTELTDREPAVEPPHQTQSSSGEPSRQTDPSRGVEPEPPPSREAKATEAGKAKTGAMFLPWKLLAVGAVVVVGVVGLFFAKSDKKPPSSPVALEPAAESSAVPLPPPSPKTGKTFRDCDQCPEMVVIREGSFIMGSPTNEKGSVSFERPQHAVQLARRFAVGKFEVTFQEWDACVAAKGCSHKPKDYGWGRGRGMQPVVDVGWKDASEFVGWLSRRTGEIYRLPSEAEWEYAARAGTTTRYPWGNEPGTNRANFNGSGSRWSDLQTAPVGSFDANDFGLHDMNGNVWEWTEDCWNDSFEGAPGDGTAWKSGNCDRRVVRGGAWRVIPDAASSASRNSGGPPYERDNYIGFRLARTL